MYIHTPDSKVKSIRIEGPSIFGGCQGRRTWGNGTEADERDLKLPEMTWGQLRVDKKKRGA